MIGRQDTASSVKRARAGKNRARLAQAADRRRFQTGNVAGGSYSREAPAGLRGTEFPTRLRPASARRICRRAA